MRFQIGPITGIYKSIPDTWMYKLGTRPCSFIYGNNWFRIFRYGAPADSLKNSDECYRPGVTYHRDRQIWQTLIASACKRCTYEWINCDWSMDFSLCIISWCLWLTSRLSESKWMLYQEARGWDGAQCILHQRFRCRMQLFCLKGYGSSVVL